MNQKMKLKARMQIGFLAIAVIFIGANIFNYLDIQKIRSASELQIKRVIDERTANEFNAQIGEVYSLQADLIINNNPSMIAEHRQSSAKLLEFCLLYTSPSPRDRQKSRMPSSA